MKAIVRTLTLLLLLLSIFSFTACEETETTGKYISTLDEYIEYLNSEFVIEDVQECENVYLNAENTTTDYSTGETLSIQSIVSCSYMYGYDNDISKLKVFTNGKQFKFMNKTFQLYKITSPLFHSPSNNHLYLKVNFRTPDNYLYQEYHYGAICNGEYILIIATSNATSNHLSYFPDLVYNVFLKANIKS